MILYIKNMVCNRCIRVVQEELLKLGYSLSHIELGKVILEQSLSPENLKLVDETLAEAGFELLSDKKSKLVEQIKNVIVEQIHHSSDTEIPDLSSSFIAGKLGHEYSSLSKLFSAAEGTTIEKYTIQHKIERVKELLKYEELSLSEISYQLGYSSVQHLSGQFRRVTGMTPSQFKRIAGDRTPLDEL